MYGVPFSKAVPNNKRGARAGRHATSTFSPSSRLSTTFRVSHLHKFRNHHQSPRRKRRADSWQRGVPPLPAPSANKQAEQKAADDGEEDDRECRGGHLRQLGLEVPRFTLGGGAAAEREGTLLARGGGYNLLDLWDPDVPVDLQAWPYRIQERT